MKFWLGVALCIGGVFLGLYVGIWVMFIGGIVDVIGEIRAETLSAMNIAIGVAKVLFSTFVGWVSFFVCLATGMGLISTSK